MFCPSEDGIEEPIYQNALLHARESLLDILQKPPDMNGDRQRLVKEGEKHGPDSRGFVMESPAFLSRLWVERFGCRSPTARVKYPAE